MKRILKAAAGVFLLSFMIVACEGSAGPQGPAGPAGPAGPDGPQGPAGEDANQNCTQCHGNDTELFARQNQYYNSVHFGGGNFERSTSSCAPCHTHEGFIERIATGEQTATQPENPSPVNCRTCHVIHTTYTEADYGFTATDPVVFWNDFHGTADFAGAGNLCSQCHQGRVLSPVPDLTTLEDVEITSFRYGYHHGPQGTVNAGVGAFFVEDAGIGSHASEGCQYCHMGDAFGDQAGGHTFNLTYEYHGGEEDLVVGCNNCHGDGFAETFDDFSTQTNVQAQLDELADLLILAGMMQDENGPNGLHYAVTGPQPAVLAAAFVNWQMFEEDRSLGLHNPRYVRDGLADAIAAVEDWLAAN
jgi:hypothetical protein